mmetsp:Transcript_2283/g.4229  ORF Transcript_2283/g.4229 Transcript_2283/m.4229 type:complete len:208 (+) Transcript_2283:60-683(+)
MTYIFVVTVAVMCGMLQGYRSYVMKNGALESAPSNSSSSNLGIVSPTAPTTLSTGSSTLENPTFTKGLLEGIIPGTVCPVNDDYGQHGCLHGCTCSWAAVSTCVKLDDPEHKEYVNGRCTFTRIFVILPACSVAVLLLVLIALPAGWKTQRSARETIPVVGYEASDAKQKHLADADNDSDSGSDTEVWFDNCYDTERDLWGVTSSFH